MDIMTAFRSRGDDFGKAKHSWRSGVWLTTLGRVVADATGVFSLRDQIFLQQACHERCCPRGSSYAQILRELQADATDACRIPSAATSLGVAVARCRSRDRGDSSQVRPRTPSLKSRVGGSNIRQNRPTDSASLDRASAPHRDRNERMST